MARREPAGARRSADCHRDHCRPPVPCLPGTEPRRLPPAPIPTPGPSFPWWLTNPSCMARSTSVRSSATWCRSVCWTATSTWPVWNSATKCPTDRARRKSVTSLCAWNSQHLVDRGSKLAISPQRPQRPQSLTGEERVGSGAVQISSPHPISVCSVLSVVEKLADNWIALREILASAAVELGLWAAHALFVGHAARKRGDFFAFLAPRAVWVFLAGHRTGQPTRRADHGADPDDRGDQAKVRSAVVVLRARPPPRSCRRPPTAPHRWQPTSWVPNTGARSPWPSSRRAPEAITARQAFRKRFTTPEDRRYRASRPLRRCGRRSRQRKAQVRPCCRVGLDSGRRLA